MYSYKKLICQEWNVKIDYQSNQKSLTAFSMFSNRLVIAYLVIVGNVVGLLVMWLLNSLLFYVSAFQLFCQYFKLMKWV